MPSSSSDVIRHNLVLVGGGHSHAIVLQMWAMSPLPGVRLTLVSDQTHTPYSGMLPGHVAGFYDYDECHIDLRRLCRAAGAQFYLDKALGLDLQAQCLICRDHPPVAFDWLSLDIGSTPGAVNVPGAERYGVAAKPVPQFLKVWENLVASLEVQPRSLSLGVVGGGAGGVELAISLMARLRQVTPQITHELHLFQRGGRLLPNHALSVGRRFEAILRGQTVSVHLNAAVQAVEQLGPEDENQKLLIHYNQGHETCDRLFWVTNAIAPPWLAESGLATDKRGFVLVSDTLQSISHPRILASGDIATMVNHPRPKAGVFAVRQGKPLFYNLKLLLCQQQARPFVPQTKLLALIGTGTGQAVASRGRWSLGPSKLLWQWKDRIDRRFMERFSELPMMGSMGITQSDMSAQAGGNQPTHSSAASLMYCSGCGAKVGSSVLEQTLSRLRNQFPQLIGDQPDDAAVLELPTNQSLIQTVDYFTSLINDPFIFGQITANHCLNDILAMGASPHSAMALVQVPHGEDSPVQEMLYQLLAGAMVVLEQYQAPLVGGHTVEGDELAFGLSCNGLGQPQQLWRKGGIEPGQALVLTKALGTGTLFAAAAQGKAKGRWIDGAIASMLQSNAPAIPVLRHHQITACTDVTGFGLLGHLSEMVKASGVSVELNLNALPCLTGAAETLALGIASSMEAQNAKAQRWINNWAEWAGEPQVGHGKARILWDPQTSGGLLVSLPSQQAAACVRALQAIGYRHSSIIGHSVETQNEPGITLS